MVLGASLRGQDSILHVITDGSHTQPRCRSPAALDGMGERETQSAVIMERVSYDESGRSSPILAYSHASMHEAKANEPRFR